MFDLIWFFIVFAFLISMAIEFASERCDTLGRLLFILTLKVLAAISAGIVLHKYIQSILGI